MSQSRKNPEDFYLVNKNPPSELIQFYKDRLIRFLETNLHVPTLLVVKNNPKLSALEIFEKLKQLIAHVKKQGLYNAILDLQGMGFIFQTRSGKKGNVPHYSISQEGDKYVLDNWHFITKNLDLLDSIKDMVNH